MRRRLDGGGECKSQGRLSRGCVNADGAGDVDGVTTSMEFTTVMLDHRW